MSKIIERSFRTTIAPTEGEMGWESGKKLIDLLHSYTNIIKVPVLLNLAAAPSQDTSYARAVEQQYLVNWDLVHVGHFDEWVNLPDGHPNTFKNYLEHHVLGKVPISPEKIALIKDVQTELGPKVTPENLAEEYGNRFVEKLEWVRSEGGVYISHGGFGENGHVAFNEPHVDKRTDKPFIPVKIDDACALQQYRDYKDNPNPAARYPSVEAVPRDAVTITMPYMLDSDHTILVVPGTQKADAVKLAIDGPLDDKVAASMMRLGKDVSLYLTTESASKLTQPMNLNY